MKINDHDDEDDEESEDNFSHIESTDSGDEIIDLEKTSILKANELQVPGCGEIGEVLHAIRDDFLWGSLIRVCLLLGLLHLQGYVVG